MVVKGLRSTPWLPERLGRAPSPAPILRLAENCDACQKPAVTFTPTTRGRRGTIALMNWAEVVKVEASESNRLVP